jgi:hypothetical protein
MNMRRRIGIIGLALALVAGLASFSACKKTANERMAENMVERAMDKATGGKADVDFSGGKMRLKTKEGETTIGVASEWPSDLPEDFPKLASGTIKGVTRTESQGSKAFHIVIEGVEAEAVEKYLETLKESGWTSQMSTTTDQGFMHQLTKDNNLVILGGNEKSLSFHITFGIE